MFLLGITGVANARKTITSKSFCLQQLKPTGCCNSISCCSQNLSFYNLQFWSTRKFHSFLKYFPPFSTFAIPETAYNFNYAFKFLQNVWNLIEILMILLIIDRKLFEGSFSLIYTELNQMVESIRLLWTCVLASFALAIRERSLLLIILINWFMFDRVFGKCLQKSWTKSWMNCMEPCKSPNIYIYIWYITYIFIL